MTSPVPTTPRLGALRGGAGAEARADRRRRVAIEVAALLAAAGLAVLIACHLAVADRAWIVYFDGDSMLPVLVDHSVRLGQPQDWALSSPLFIPEMALFGAISLSGLPVAAILTLNGIANWLLLYGAIRFVSGAVARRGAAVAALAAFAVVASLALLEPSSSRDSFENASLLSTGTYYSATEIASVLVVGLGIRVLRPGANGAGVGTRLARPPVAWCVALGVVVAGSVLTNPLFILWGVAPLLAAVVLAVLTRVVARRIASICVLVVVVAVGVGMLGRLPFAGLLTESPSAIYRPDEVGGSAPYYAALLLQLGRTAQGVVELVLLLATAVSAVAALVASRRDMARFVVAGVALGGPVVVAVGAVLVGTSSARYLEPVMFLPASAILAIPRSALPVHRPVRLGAAVAAVVGIAVVASSLLTPDAVRQSPETRAMSASVQCVDDWVMASGRTGAGEYWTVRAPKAYLADPRRLVQVDGNLHAYLWLVNQADYDGLKAVSFVVEDAGSASLRIPERSTPRWTRPPSCSKANA